jgi:hypothetical protein
MNCIGGYSASDLADFAYLTQCSREEGSEIRTLRGHGFLYRGVIVSPAGHSEMSRAHDPSSDLAETALRQPE